MRSVKVMVGSDGHNWLLGKGIFYRANNFRCYAVPWKPLRSCAATNESRGKLKCVLPMASSRGSSIISFRFCFFLILGGKNSGKKRKLSSIPDHKFLNVSCFQNVRSLVR